MSKTKNALFNLIKSLSQSEKIYFKKFSKLHVLQGDNTYIRLFDILNGMDAYDEDVVCRKLKNESYAKNLIRNKRILYELILRSLRNYHAKNMTRVQINDLMNEFIILEDKGLSRQAFKRLNKAEKLAQAYERDLDALKILGQKRKFFRERPPKKRTQVLEALHNESKVLLDKILLELKFMKWYEHILPIFQARRLTPDLLNEGFEGDVNLEAMTFNSKLTYLYLQARYYRSIPDFKEAEKYYEAVKVLFNENKKMKIEYNKQYAGVLNSCFNTYFLSGNMDKTPDLIEELEVLKKIARQGKKKPDLTWKTIQIYIYNMKLLYLIDQAKYKEAIRNLVEEVEQFLSLYSGNFRLEWLLNFKFNIAKVFFLEGVEHLYIFREARKNFEAALERIVEIRKIEDTVRPDLHFEALLCQIVIYLEQKEYYFTNEKLIPDAQWFLKKFREDKTKDFRLEERLLKLFSKYASDKKRKRENALMEIAAAFEGVTKYEEVRLWVEGRRSKGLMI